MSQYISGSSASLIFVSSRRVFIYFSSVCGATSTLDIGFPVIVCLSPFFLGSSSSSFFTLADSFHISVICFAASSARETSSFTSSFFALSFLRSSPSTLPFLFKSILLPLFLQSQNILLFQEP